MANVIKKATNKFTKGLVMDFSPENTKNEVLTHALNATLLTFNGNELSLQNDMGNARVETAFLPDGYIPVGTCEYGGIVYVVSYNPLEDKSQIGCFPSPERNISNKELGISDAKIAKDYFQYYNEDGVFDGTISNMSQYVLLRDSNLNPGDKFIVCSDTNIYNEKLEDLWKMKDGSFELVPNPILALNVVSIEDSGRIIYLNSDIINYECFGSNGETYKYRILGSGNSGAFDQENIDIDSYRNTLSSGYSVFKSKTSGKLAILAELISIDSYSVTHDVIPKKDDQGNVIDGCFDICIYTEVSPNVTEDNYIQVPKLKYYFLKNSQGYLQKFNNLGEIREPLFETEDGVVLKTVSDSFLDTYLSDIYTSTTDNTLNLNKTLRQSGKFNLPKVGSYHATMRDFDGDVSENTDVVFTKFKGNALHRIKKSQIIPIVNGKETYTNFYNYYINEINASFYRYNKSGKSYQEFVGEELEDSATYYIRESSFQYYNAERDIAYNGHELFKCVTDSQVASLEIIQDKSIQKYVQQVSDIYTLVDVIDDNTDMNNLWYPTTSGGKITYKQANAGDIQEGQDYYSKSSVQELVPISQSNAENSDSVLYYYPGALSYQGISNEEYERYFNFNLFPKTDDAPNYGFDFVYYRREPIDVFRPATTVELESWKELNLTLYYNSYYQKIDPSNMGTVSDLTYQIFMTAPVDVYIPYQLFNVNPKYNWIEGQESLLDMGIDEPEYSQGEQRPGYPDEKPVTLHTISEFIPSDDPNSNNYLVYNDLILGNIKIPNVLAANGIDLPFKYDYTLVPCMNYGKLDSLAVSNTVDFSKLHAFNQSGFNTWKYRIDGNQLMLTFGADIFDNYETHKVDALVLEFYDMWGFAGSLEIANKKSFSGVFTKLLTLNTLGTLSTKKVSINGYTTTYTRNANFSPQKDGTIKYNGAVVTYSGDDYGWRYSGGSFPSGENDCGVLYSNLIYGVKTYLRRTIEGAQQFIRKQDFFLFTMPIYNDFYYSIDNYNNISNPQLNLALTYKLKDSSTITPYNHEETQRSQKIDNGYTTTDGGHYSDYTSGQYQATTLNLTKYFKFEGTSNLQLEIGLKQEYEKYNLKYDAAINKYFSCSLRLVSDSSETETFTVGSSDKTIVIESEILNYTKNNDTIIDSLDGVNNIGFGSSYATTYTIPYNQGDSFADYNFINNPENKSIEIKYKFVAGFDAYIEDIRTTQVPATTVCALYHKNNDGEFNPEDFGVHVVTNAQNEQLFLSNAMFFNSGTSDTEKVGICQQNNTSGNMSEMCSVVDSKSPGAGDITQPGKLNSGSSLKHLSQYIGKLTFCQPHAHAIDTDNGVNIYNDKYGIPKYAGGEKLHENAFGGAKRYDDVYGISPASYMFSNPRFNLSLNTEVALKNHGEFLSTMHWKTINNGTRCSLSVDYGWYRWIDEYCRQFVGLSGAQLAIFNKKLLKTMSGVYAYNPDYDSLSISQGSVQTQSYYPYFTSNLLCTNSGLNLEKITFNDLIYLGILSISSYIKQLGEYSKDRDGIGIVVYNNDKAIPQLNFIPGFDYCGTKDRPLLLSQLTYNTTTPKAFEEELNFNSSSVVVVKDTQGLNYTIRGKIDKKAFYYFNKDQKKLIQLDVSNYEIQDDGSVSCTTTNFEESESDVITTPITTDYFQTVEHVYSVKTDYNKARFRGTSLTLNDLLYKPNDTHRLYIKKGLCNYDSSIRGKLYYRTLSTNTDGESSKHGTINAHTSWKYEGTKNRNTLFLFTGPAFTPDNL